MIKYPKIYKFGEMKDPIKLADYMYFLYKNEGMSNEDFIILISDVKFLLTNIYKWNLLEVFILVAKLDCLTQYISKTPIK